MSIIILGAGLSGLSLAYFLNKDSIILEKEEQIGGLCRSFELNGIFHDIGPHIIFSKNRTNLKEIIALIKTNTIKRSNKIFHNGKLIKYPFENDLATLNTDERKYCLRKFLNNPYKNIKAKNMFQFFLKTFGEGITKLYLQPYNEKMWKYDLTLIDTQMVERIPRPPREDVIKSAKGIATEGYVHQLYFHYPNERGIQQIIMAYKDLISGKSKIINPIKIKKIYKENGGWSVETDKGKFTCKRLINCMPLHELFKYIEAPVRVKRALSKLKYNSIYIMALQVKKDNMGQSFAIYFADKNIIFHRLSNINFLGKNYCLDKNASTIMAEITYRSDGYFRVPGAKEIQQKTLDDLENLGIINKNNIISMDLKNFKYAYVIYDLGHRQNTNLVLRYLSEIGIECCGRFAEFEYLNMDQVVKHSKDLAKKLNRQKWHQYK